MTDQGLEAVNNDKPLGAVALKSFREKLEKRSAHRCHHGERPERRNHA